MGEIKTAYNPDTVIFALNHCRFNVPHLLSRVFNTFKSMVTDDDVLEKEDAPILDRMKAFVSSEEVSHFGAAKQLLVLIERAVRGSCRKIALHLSSIPATRWR